MNDMHDENPFLITPDLSEAVEMTGAPPGMYSGRVAGLELKKAKSGGTYIKWEIKIFGAGGELEKFNNWSVYYNTMTSGKGAGMLKNFVKACTGEDLPQKGAYDFSKLFGCEFSMTLVQGKDSQGNPSNYPEVTKIKPLANATPF